MNWFGISATKYYRGSCNIARFVLYYARLDHYKNYHLSTQLQELLTPFPPYYITFLTTLWKTFKSLTYI